MQDAAFGYVSVFRTHMNVGLFNGAILEDPAGLLEGNGKFMRHVKMRPVARNDLGESCREQRYGIHQITRRRVQLARCRCGPRSGSCRWASCR